MTTTIATAEHRERSKTEPSGRLIRLLKLINLLQEDRARTADQFAQRLTVSRRTVFRDIKTLQKAGVPVVKRPGGGYLIAKDYSDIELGLNVTEALGLMVLAKIAGSMSQQPLLNSAIDAVGKITSMLPAPVHQVYDDLMKQVTVTPGDVNICRDDGLHYRTLQYCIEDRMICHVEYEAVDPDGTCEMKIHPLHLHFWKNRWYAIAFSEEHGEIRMFKLSRFAKLEATDEQFPPRSFSIEKYLDDAWGIIPEGKKYNVVIEFTPLVARNVSEIQWHHTQQTSFNKDGSCEMRFRVNGLNEIKWWILGYGDQALVKQPRELRRMVRQAARAMMALYPPTDMDDRSVPVVHIARERRKNHPSL